MARRMSEEHVYVPERDPDQGEDATSFDIDAARVEDEATCGRSSDEDSISGDIDEDTAADEAL